MIFKTSKSTKNIKVNTLLYLCLSITAGIYCKKNHDQIVNQNGSIQIISGAGFANTTNSLQAIYSDAQLKYKTFYFGSFDAQGNADSIKSLIIKKNQGDTTLQIQLDQQLRATSIYFRINGISDSLLLTLNYDTTGQTTVRTFFYDTATQNTRLKSEYTVKTSSTPTLIRNQSYASIGNIFNPILLQISGGGSNVPSRLGSQLITLQGSIAGLNVVIITASTAIGCLIAGFPGCITGGMLGSYIAFQPASANAESLADIPNGSPTFVSHYYGYRIGDNVFGGKVFTISSGGLHGYVCMPLDISPSINWQGATVAAANFVSNGYGGWVLPTRIQIQQLYYYRNILGLFHTGCDNSNFGLCSYWTSDLNGSQFAWCFYFTNGNFWSNYATNANAAARAVRAF